VINREKKGPYLGRACSGLLWLLLRLTVFIILLLGGSLGPLRFLLFTLCFFGAFGNIFWGNMPRSNRGCYAILVLRPKVFIAVNIGRVTNFF
jgi:vacuolar-type H+-ATPase subunit I/STV1